MTSEICVFNCPLIKYLFFAVALSKQIERLVEKVFLKITFGVLSKH